MKLMIIARATHSAILSRTNSKKISSKQDLQLRGGQEAEEVEGKIRLDFEITIRSQFYSSSAKAGSDSAAEFACLSITAIWAVVAISLDSQCAQTSIPSLAS
jgi:hypothetical protein